MAIFQEMDQYTKIALARIAAYVELDTTMNIYGTQKQWSDQLNRPDGLEFLLNTGMRGPLVDNILSQLDKAERNYGAEQREAEIQAAAHDQAQREAEIDVARRVLGVSVRADVLKLFPYDELDTVMRGPDVTTSVKNGEDGVHIGAIARGYVGRQGRGKVSRRDLAKLERLQVDPGSISFDSIDGLTIERRGFGVTPVNEVPDLDLTGKRGATHIYQFDYASLIPYSKLPSVLAKHGLGK